MVLAASLTVVCGCVSWEAPCIQSNYGTASHLQQSRQEAKNQLIHGLQPGPLAAGGLKSQKRLRVALLVASRNHTLTLL